MLRLTKKTLLIAAVFLGGVTLSPGLSRAADAYGTLCSSLTSGIGTPGLPCVVADPEFDYGPSGDTETSVEAALSYIYDTSIMLNKVGEAPDSGDFDTGTFGDFIITGTANSDNEYTGISWEYTGPGGTAPEFATVKAANAYAIFHIGGLTTGQLFTTGLIMNQNNNARGISHIRFWDSGDRPPEVSEPGILGLLGLALSGLYVFGRRRRKSA